MKRRRVRAWWGRRKFKPLKYEFATALHAYENEIILRKVRELHDVPKMWVFDSPGLLKVYPDTFNAKHLERALKRMTRQGYLKKSKGFRRLYTLDERPAEAEQAA